MTGKTVKRAIDSLRGVYSIKWIGSSKSGTPKPRRYRNRRLGDFLKELDLTEGKSTGIATVRSKLKSNGSPAAIYEFDKERTYFSATVKIHPEFPREDEGQKSLTKIHV